MTTSQHAAPGSAALLQAAAPILDECAERFSGDMLATGRADPTLGPFLRHLDSRELAEWRHRHAEHLQFLTSSAASDGAIRRRALAGGRVHATIGIGAAVYAQTLGAFRTAAIEALDSWSTRADRIAVWGVINHRVFLDLQGHLEGHYAVSAQTAKVAAAVGHAAARAVTVADLARSVLHALTELPGLTIGCFGRPHDGEFQFEVGAGERVDEFLREANRPLPDDSADAGPFDAPQGQSPPARAWRSGLIARSDAYRADATTAPWHDMSKTFGFRSSVAIPLTDRDRQPRALIACYSVWPEFFAEAARAQLMAQVRDTVQSALVRIEAGQELSSGFSEVGTRAAHIAMLDRRAVTMLYQPIIDLRTGAVTKLEALARLGGGTGDGEKAIRGRTAAVVSATEGVDNGELISPAEFLPSFGQQELWRLFEIGLDQSLAALARWDAEGFVTSVSLNLPATFALTHRHGATVAQALQRHGIAPERLTLEVLETGVIEHSSSGYRQVLERIRDLGVRIAEDDLGTAYSSLFRLRYLPFDEVKIAQELIRDSGSDPRQSWGFIQPLANLVHQMRRTVTAEGLESAGLIEAAAFLGADHGQGFAIARPMPAREVPSWAGGYVLRLDPSNPSTGLGALAAHLGWELRLSTFADRPDLAVHAVGDSCPMTRFLARPGVGSGVGRADAAAGGAGSRAGTAHDGAGSRAGTAHDGAAHDGAATLAEAHDAVHAAAAVGLGSDEHHRAWQRLTSLLLPTGR